MYKIELDSMSEASSRPITPANSLIRPNTGYLSKRQLSRPPSRERYGYQKLSVIDQTLEEGSRESISVTPDIGAKSNKMSKRSASASSSHGQLDPHHSGIRSPEELDRSGTSGVDDNDDNEEEYIEDQDLADNEIREIEGKAQASMGEDNLHHLGIFLVHPHEPWMIYIICLYSLDVMCCVFGAYLLFYLLYRYI